MRIGKWNDDGHVFVIAEIGNNHEGDFKRACDLIHFAADSGADAVKFQTIVPEKLVVRSDEKRIAQLKRFQFSYEQYAELAATATAAGVVFLSTPFDLESAQFLNGLVPAFKIASSDNNFYPLLRKVAEFEKPILISSGLADFAQVTKTVEFVRSVWANRNCVQELGVLHCVTSYPTLPQDANLGSIHKLKSLPVVVGYSDHTLGITAPVLAVAAGARIIEKHFTLDKNLSEFRDHKLSADPTELKELVSRIRETETYMGVNEVQVQESERSNSIAMRRSISAGRDLDSGKPLVMDDFAWVRPGHGLPPGDEERLIGKTLRRPLRQGELILPVDLV